MTNPTNSDETKRPEDAVADTDEPAEATRLRSEDDAETKARQAQTEAGLREADRRLEDGVARLRQTRAELQERERELERTSDLTRKLAENARELRAQMAQITQDTRRSPKGENPESPPTPESRDSET